MISPEHTTDGFNWKHGEIPRSELEIKAVRGGGPGGQAINTTSNNVEVRWNMTNSQSLSEEQKETLRAKAGRRVTKADELIFTSQSERSQKQNIEDAVNRLNQFIRDALTPEKKRVKTKKSTGTKKKERKAREKLKQKKKTRGRVNDW